MKHAWGLTPLQRASVVGGIALAAVVGLAIALGVDAGTLSWLKAAEPTALFAVALVARKRLPSLGLVVIALGLSAGGDLAMTGLLPLRPADIPLVGMGLFAAAYLALIAVFWRPPQRTDWGWLAPYGAFGLALLALLWPSIPDALRLATPAFTAVVVVMAWTLGMAPERRILRRRVASWAAAGGVVLLASDAGVAFAMFSPPAGRAAVWLDVYVTTAYAVGWLLLLLVAVDPTPKASPAPWEVVTPLPDADPVQTRPGGRRRVASGDVLLGGR